MTVPTFTTFNVQTAAALLVCASLGCAGLRRPTATGRTNVKGTGMSGPRSPRNDTRQLFNGKDLAGWDGNLKYWSVENGEIVGRKTKIRRNQWLTSKLELSDFRLIVDVKMINETGNSGIQFRSRMEMVRGRMAMKGYQADIGPGWWGKLYEEHGRGLIWAKSGEAFVKRGDWNTYEILAVGDRVRTAINGNLCVDMNDPRGDKKGVIAFQLHTGFGGKVEIRFRIIELERNPEFKLKTVPARAGRADRDKDARPPAAAPRKSPLTVEEQIKTFSLPDGFEIELVAADPDIIKVVDIAFDDAGRMWAVTAIEYPLDANENKGVAEVYKRGGRDRVIVFDTPTRRGRQTPRTFADNLALPMTVLPYKDGAFVGHGPEILFFRDTDGDGKADEREVILSGFGIQDSHLMPHRFVRAPGGWVYMAQGAFNSSNVRARNGDVIKFNKCKVGRFTLDGSRFEIAGWGLNNIWGFVIDRHGEMFIQEANDHGYSVVPFSPRANYPGIGMDRSRPYAPWQPPLASFRMGGTGLSGLAMSEDPGGFPPPYDGVMFVANPIVRKVQAIRIHREGPAYRLEKLPDFLTSTDPWFRPIAIHFGPDGCLYIVDWYNKIISHNEVPRAHPERDKTRSRIWRVRHRTMPRRKIPNVAAARESRLIDHLLAESTWEARAAWHQIVDRPARTLTRKLQKIARSGRSDHRILALWCLEGLGRAGPDLIRELVRHENRSVRREAVRVLGGRTFNAKAVLSIARGLVEERDPQVRAELIRTLDQVGVPALELLVRMGRPPLDGPTIRTAWERTLTHTGEAADRDFERYLVRMALEEHPQAGARFLRSPAGRALSAEQRLLAALSIGEAAIVAEAIGQLPRSPTKEELAFLAAHIRERPVNKVFTGLLRDPQTQQRLLEILQQLPAPGPEVSRAVADALRKLLRREPSDANAELMLRFAASWRMRELEQFVADMAVDANQPERRRLAAVKALREMESTQAKIFWKLAATSAAGEALRREAVSALASIEDERASGLLFQLWPTLLPSLRQAAINRLSTTPFGARTLLTALESRIVSHEDLNGRAIDRLKRVLRGDPRLTSLMRQLAGMLRPSLRLNGDPNGYVDSNIELREAFTVETWVKLDPRINKHDGILGAPKSADLNFHQAKFRFYAGRKFGDVIVAQRAIRPDEWTHVAVTRNADGRFKIYVNGELDRDKGKVCTLSFRGLDIGRTIASRGTSGWLAEFRVWDVERTAQEIRMRYEQSFEGAPRPGHLVHYFPGGGPWGKLQGKARVERTFDYPPIVTLVEAAARDAELDAFRKHAVQPGDVRRGKALFAGLCATCHSVGGQGGEIGPNLDGAGAKSLDELLRAILRPNLSIESGYRLFRAETAGGEILDGFLTAQDETSIVLRRLGREDLRIARREIKHASFQNVSLMPEGLLESMKPREVSDLFAYLRSLK